MEPSPLSVAQLAAMQKRAIDWSAIAERGTVNTHIRTQMQALIKRYRLLLTKSWQASAISSEDQATLKDLERQLEFLSEEARLQPGNTPVGKENYQKYL
jgi:hypothetical protein